MRLLISEASRSRLENFANTVGARVECAPLRIAISASHVSIIFFQPEQYSRLINCEFRFSPDVAFFYEDVHAALLAVSTSNSAHLSPKPDNIDEIGRNDDYISKVTEFCKEHWSDIIKTPPSWYEKAVEISDKSIRQIFPAIADEDLGNKMRLLYIWQNRRHE